jgi:hypothetical protein
MGEAKRRKKLDPNYGKKRSTNLNEEEEKDLEITILESIGKKYERLFPPRSPGVIDYLYLKVSHGLIRCRIRFDIYESWVNPDLSVETMNEMVSMIWRTDGKDDEKGKTKWLNCYESTIRNYATDSWLKLRYKNIEQDIPEILNKQTR